MITLLSVIGFIVAVGALSFYLQKYGKEKYSYSVFSIGGMAVSFIGAIAFAFSYNYHVNHQVLAESIAIAIGSVPYIIMFIRDSKKMTITLAIAAMIMRLTISTILIIIILWYAYGRRSSMDEIKQSLKNIERKLA